ncbi:MAG: tetratricopeptide repeat protein [Cyclobacteriaceae bacterium]|jgi:tetratricopeptide (TPR) repeat protein|nr:tetratricopeptide repeat protein [Cyclobacteriaceae bacterium]
MTRLSLAFLFICAVAAGQTRIDQAKLLYESQKYEDAKKLLASIDEKNKDYATAQYWLGRIAYAQEKYDDASDHFEEATEANDKVADYWNWLGNTYGTIAQDANTLKQGMLAPKMRSAWEKAIALDPQNLDARSSLIQYYSQAPGFMGGSTEKAKEMANQIKKIKPAEGHRQLGNIYYREKKFAEAEKEFLAMVKADATYQSGLASFYANQKQYDKAFALFQETLKTKPDDMSTVYQYGRLSALSGQQLDQGEAHLKRYLAYSPAKNEPTHAGAHMRLAQIYEKRGNKSEAKKSFETALKMDNNLKEAKEGLARVSK